MSWAAEHWLWALALPAGLLIWNLARRRRAATELSLEKARYATAGFRSIHLSERRARRPLRLCFCLSLTLMTLALARPRWGVEEEISFQRSREVLIALDLSRSMLADDVKPSRLARAKVAVESMLGELQGESVGLIVFAGTAFLQSPMSPDYQILRGFLRDLNPSFVPQGGTNFRAMLRVALDSFRQSDGGADRFLIVISDGESTVDNWQPLARELSEANVTALTLGFGTSEGALIPDGQGGYHKDSQGAVVLSRLERSSLQELASLTDGVYRDAQGWLDLAGLIEETVKRGRAALTEQHRRSHAVERYHYFLAPALLLLLLAIYREIPAMPKARNLRREAYP